MRVTKTHISTSGKRVPCTASKRTCPRGGHEFVTTTGSSDVPRKAAGAPDYDAKLLARHERGGANPKDSKALLDDLYASHEGNNLVYALVYNGFATLAFAEKVAAARAEAKTTPQVSREEFAEKMGFVNAGPDESAKKPAFNGTGVGRTRSFFAPEDVMDRRRLAKDSTDATELDVLAKNKDKITVVGVAANRNASPALLTKLSRHKDWGVRVAVAKNPSTPKSVLDVLRQDENQWVRDEVR